MNQRRSYRDLPDLELSGELDDKILAMTRVADQDIDESRVTFQWGPEQLATVKRAADLLGVPYQAYIKQVLFRQALEDIQAVDAISSVR
jgi:predicted DNA binding CopG/RHH family protein